MELGKYNIDNKVYQMAKRNVQSVKKHLKAMTTTYRNPTLGQKSNTGAGYPNVFRRRISLMRRSLRASVPTTHSEGKGPAL